MQHLSWPIFRVTEKAALAAWPEVGCGDKNIIDGLAVSAMREELNTLPMQGKIVIGEGEIDCAPMLYIGEEVGNGQEIAIDIAVDPIEGTRMAAMGQSNALAVIAFAPRDTLFHAPDMYMKKLVVCHQAKGCIDIKLSLSENLNRIAQALNKPLSSLRMVTLDKPRLKKDIEEALHLGVKVFAFADGDVAASILTCQRNNEFDLMYTIGGAPEGVITACAVKAMNGDMQAELIDYCQAKGDSENGRKIAQSEYQRCQEMNVKINHCYELDELVKSDQILFSATGVTSGDLLRGISQNEHTITTQTLVINGIERTTNIISSQHYR
ncbi:class II fructose-bisphosphatase [Providencia burhodogranariea]|uniref:Fructose-1,6-bisphosphatase n=1 Tax=Providencia burhodogranariea DSM 19968 TaxID=1141662 RepID=K8WD65_9GAMM|nr:class II fructose-bisphosphatase [Providencia burhodogranariea]EKT55367.1 fructose-1,6-bisphosphatase II-like protein [Providencia burhodogranariea DSM 19968]